VTVADAGGAFTATVPAGDYALTALRLPSAPYACRAVVGEKSPGATYPG